ncbi:malonyl-CoA synthase [Aestuariibius sp. HNIBRBA575]|uniref:malonate--CoA ligase n=1 Tax=Aestuariibius sp. HNIBRBA575 TaxID=3233343 RepID=UPI0034A182D7
MANPLYEALFAPHLNAESVFLHLPDGTDVTHGAFLRRAAQFAHSFCVLGLRPGDRVAVQIDKSPDALAVYAACVQTGLVFLPLNTAYTAAELDYFISNSGAGLVLSGSAKAGDVGAVANTHKAKHLTLDADGTGGLAALADMQPGTFVPVDRDADDLAAILYTSGTTGRSKGAMLSQRNLLSNAEVLKDAWQFTDQDVLLHGLPIYHTHGLFVGTNITLLAGGSMIFLPGFDLDTLIRFMPRATALMGVPTYYTRLLGDNRFDAKLAQNMRLFVSGSAPLLAETHQAFETRTGHRILERYGMTETNMSTSNPYSGDRRPGTVGRMLPGVDGKVCDPEGRELPRGEIGILEVRGDNVFKGYWQMPEKTAAELRDDGFFITGDLAVMGEDDYVTIVGRGKDLIICGGLNVYPKEVEEALDALPGIIESAVIGVPHPDMGEGIIAVLAAPSDLNLDDVAGKLAQNLARFKQPRHYVIVDALPRNTMGKVQKAALRTEFATWFTSK